MSRIIQEFDDVKKCGVVSIICLAIFLIFAAMFSVSWSAGFYKLSILPALFCLVSLIASALFALTFIDKDPWACQRIIRNARGCLDRVGSFFSRRT